MTEGLTSTVSVDYKIGLPGFGSAGCFVSIIGITPDTTEDEMDEILDQSRIAFAKITARIKKKAQFLRDLDV